MTCLTELREHVRAAREADWPTLAIDDLCLDNLFLSVRLNDGSVGTAMNYDLEGRTSITLGQVDATRQHLLAYLPEQPLLWDFLEEPGESLARRALLVALLSALSAPLLGDHESLTRMGLHSSQGRIPLSAFRATGARKVTIVGFGGYLEEALAQTWLDRVCCCDYLAFDPEFRRHNPYPFQIYEEASQRMEVIYDDGARASELIADADIVCLSASTLCNGTLQALLPIPRQGRVVILEGPSGGVLPGPLLERGITHLVHNPVDVDFVSLCHRFSRQTRLGLQKIGAGRFIDVILPEQRTVRGAAGLRLESAST